MPFYTPRNMRSFNIKTTPHCTVGLFATSANILKDFITTFTWIKQTLKFVSKNPSSVSTATNKRINVPSEYLILNYQIYFQMEKFSYKFLLCWVIFLLLVPSPGVSFRRYSSIAKLARAEQAALSPVPEDTPSIPQRPDWRRLPTFQVK